MTDRRLRFSTRTIHAPRSGRWWDEIELHDAWWEAPIPDTPWTAAFRLAIQEGKVIPGELRVFPTEDWRLNGTDDEPGTWSAESYGPAAEVPPGGITGTILRKVPFSSLDSFPDVIEWLRDSYPQTLERIESEGFNVDRLARPRRGPQGLSDEEVVEHADAYLAHIRAGVKNPHVRLSRSKKITTERSKYILNVAKDRGLYASPATSNGRGGRAGGSLTPQGEAILGRIQRRTIRKSRR